MRETQPDRNTLGSERITPLDPWYVLSFKRPGVQNGVFRKLRQGRYEALARLDMHRMSVEQARRELEVVQAFHSAQPQHGGTGAVYVLLKKSEEKKQETREQLSRGRGG